MGVAKIAVEKWKTEGEKKLKQTRVRRVKLEKMEIIKKVRLCFILGQKSHKQTNKALSELRCLKKQKEGTLGLNSVTKAETSTNLSSSSGKMLKQPK